MDNIKKPIVKIKSKNEICYPYIYENKGSIDFEIISDELCTRIGLAISLLQEKDRSKRYKLIKELKKIQSIVYEFNGSIRGNDTITEEKLNWLNSLIDHHKNILGKQDLFVLPSGKVAAVEIHLARSCAKKLTRQLAIYHYEGLEIKERHFRFANLLSNYFNVFARAINKSFNFKEISFRSENYPSS